MTATVKVTGVAKTQANLKRLAKQSPARARRAVNRTIGVARQRVIKSISASTGVSRAVIGGRRGRRLRGGGSVKGQGYVKAVRASKRRSEGALVVLVSGVRFRNLRRKTVGGLKTKPGGLSSPFRATMPNGQSLTVDRRPPARGNLPIREIVIPLQPHAGRAIDVHMRRAARSVYPEKIWQELQKSIKPVR